ncbi:unnamed protein product [Nezara viridula]|uniref:Uncharacterized protein n=2 Tax=Nezara viridula TaxID=85310 RepID=A0A9P0E5C1_NEZVI|nr:unnamed protein product [Nezara viridula]
MAIRCFARNNVLLNVGEQALKGTKLVIGAGMFDTLSTMLTFKMVIINYNSVEKSFISLQHLIQLICSDKCLNQYKMNIFCKETEAHLEAHPHLRESTVAESGPGLITPDLWLRDCRSPASEESLSPQPSLTMPDGKKEKEAKKKGRRQRRIASPPRIPLHPLPPPLLPPPWRRKPDVPALVPIARPVPMLPGLLPPPTTLVPYPIFFPIPIPIPIPLPLPGLKMSDLEGAKKTEPTQPTHLAQPPPRKRKRITDISQENEAARKPKTVHA